MLACFGIKYACTYSLMSILLAELSNLVSYMELTRIELVYSRFTAFTIPLSNENKRIIATGIGKFSIYPKERFGRCCYSSNFSCVSFLQNADNFTVMPLTRQDGKVVALKNSSPKIEPKIEWNSSLFIAPFFGLDFYLFIYFIHDRNKFTLSH